jgi:hypothetical protein
LTTVYENYIHDETVTDILFNITNYAVISSI